MKKEMIAIRQFIRKYSMKNVFFLLTAVLTWAQATALYADRHCPSRAVSAKIYGTVEQMPATGTLLGVWQINGRQVLIDSRTEIEQKHGSAEVGAYVKAEGCLVNTTFTAYEMEVESSGDRKLPIAAYNFIFSGIIAQMPENGYEGQWIIADRPVEVDRATVIDETQGKASCGCRAKVKGIRTKDTVRALEIIVAAMPHHS